LRLRYAAPATFDAEENVVMLRLSKLYLLTIVASLSFATPAPAESLLKVYSASEREAIRLAPIEDRPMRIGHFYGNTVRRLNRFGR
jgi:hypothetical protein